MKALRFLLLALAACAGCQSYPFAFQTNQRVEARNYQAQIFATDKTDILFVIDNSPSMDEERANLKANIGAFIDVLSQGVVDYQVGIITPDADRVPGPACSPCCDLDTDHDGIPDFSGCDGGRLASADGVHRFFTRPVSDDPVELATKTKALVDDFNAVVSALGEGGSPYERTFENVITALSQDSEFAVRALNFGFLRPDADLAVIIMSDEDDCSHDDKSWFTQFGRDDSDCYIDPTASPPSEFTDFLVTLKAGNSRRVRAAAIVGTVPSAAPLGYSAAGCYTDDSGDPSNSCGCWSTRFVPDRTTSDPNDELFCDLLSEPPYNQTPNREPDLGHGQGGCSTLPGSRYVSFLEDLNARHIADGETNNTVLVDSLCRADYGETLTKIANNVVLNNCFSLIEQPDVDFDSVVVKKNGEVLPRVAGKESTDPGWYYSTADNQICLAGGLIKQVNDTYEITVVSQTRGFDSGD